MDSSTSAHSKIYHTNDGRYSIYLKQQPGHRYSSKLVIQNTQASDSGIYKCRVNVRWSAVIERHYRVHVQGKLNKNIYGTYIHISILMWQIKENKMGILLYK